MANYNPPAKGMTPPQYYTYLIGVGVPQSQAMAITQQYYGPVQNRQQQQKDAQKNKTTQEIGAAGGMIGGYLATNYIKDNAGNWWNKATGKPATQEEISAIKAKPEVTAKPTAEPTSGGAETAEPVTDVGSTTMPDGTPGRLMSDGGKVGDNGKIVNPDGTSGGSLQGQALAGLQVAGGAAQAYSGYKQYQSGEKLGGAANMAGGAYGAAAGAQSLAAGGTAGSLAEYVPAVGAAVAGAQIGQQMLNKKGASEDRAAKSQAEAEKAALLFIPGYGWVAYAALAGLDAITGGKATQYLMKANKASNKLTDRIDFGLGKSIRSKVFHQSTKGVQEMHTGQLLQQSDDPTWQNYVAGMRMQQTKEGPPDKTKPFAGKYATFDEYKKAGLQASDLTGVYGNIDAFKPDYAEKAGVPNWANLNFNQQKAVTQRLIDENMYSSKKGEVVISDKDKARKIYEEMAKTNFATPTPVRSQPATSVQIPNSTPIPKSPMQQPQSKKNMSIRDTLNIKMGAKQQ